MPLTDAKARAAKPAEKRFELVDGDGLALVVMPSGSKVWRLRYRTEAGERKRVVLGKFPDLGIAAARVEATKLRAQVYTGHDPAAERAAKRVEVESLAEVVAGYIDDHQAGWKDTTRSTYLSSIGTFTAWAESAKIKRVADLTPGALGKYRAYALNLPRRIKAKGGSRKDVVSTGERRSAAAINCDLRAVKTMLQALRKAGRLPAIKSSDDIADNLGLLALEQARPDPLKPAQLRKLLAACRAHDAETWTMTRVEARGEAPVGSTPKHEPIGPLVALMLLSGMRLGEALALTWADVDLHEQTIRVLPGKTSRERAVDLSITPGLARVLGQLRGDGSGCVFNHTQVTALDARLRLIADHGAPAFLWSVRNSRPGERSAPTLRSTCGCYLTCAPSIFGAASVYMSAAQLGHSVEVAQKHYLGALRRISPDAKTVEAAMGIEREIEALITQLAAR